MVSDRRAGEPSFPLEGILAEGGIPRRKYSA
jgi:hypothetical protein